MIFKCYFYQGETTPGKPGQTGTKQDKTGQNRTKQDKTGQNGTKRDKPGQNGTNCSLLILNINVKNFAKNILKDL